MCGRFTLNETPAKLAVHFKLDSAVDFPSSWNIAPSTRICSITADVTSSRHLNLMRWGLKLSWAKNSMTNARGETVAEKPSFRSAFKSRRCIIPASGFYEWATENGAKQPWYFSLKSGEPMAFAGLWETAHPPEGETCCIITKNANELMQPIHDRMPVILPLEHWETWLSPNEKQADKLLPMIQPHEFKLMQAWQVTMELNKVGLRNDAGLIEQIKSSIYGTIRSV